ncbi:Transcription factor (Predicted) [Pleurostoma richardsiae]|uniref:Transcription factor (Predicted) n=1 Tax=Pleurostoma richardsiae TaxID=41990 RepID=A0AA38VV61_9PEZI|nr:Transcription factor (Predicted) [Pleurostoma richardsiae]
MEQDNASAQRLRRTLQACRACPSRARQDYSLSSAEEVGNLYAKIARRMARDTSDQPTVPNIQANLVLALSELLSGSGSRQWMYAGNAIRMAQVMRLNKDFHQRHPPREQEIRRRIFWACFVFDRLLASSMAKPRTLSVGNIGIALPSTDLALAYREETRGFTLDTLNAFSGAPSEIGIMPFLLVTVSLFSDIADIHICRGRFNEKLPPTDPRSQFFQRHAAMREWAGSLPSWLRWNEHNYSVHDDLGLGKEFTAMHLLLRSSMCIAHQGYLPQNDGSSILLDTLDAAGLSLLHRDDGLISTCVSNALAVGEMVTWLAREERSADANLRSPWVAIALLSVSPSLLWLQYSDESQDHAASSGLARSFLESFNLLLQSWRSSWRVASEWLAVLDGMERLYRSAYLGEVSEGSPEGSQGEGSHADAVDEEEPGQYRPKPGDGFPHISTAAPLYTMLRLSGSGASPISPAETQQHWMWLQLIETWPHNLSEVSMQGLDDDSLRFLGMS